MTKDYKNIPFLSISKEVLRLMYDTLENEQMGNILKVLYEFIYEGIEPHFNSKVENGVWNNLIAVIDRKAEGYLKQVEAGKYGAKGGRPKKESTNENKAPEEPLKDENDKDIIPTSKPSEMTLKERTKEALFPSDSVPESSMREKARYIIENYDLDDCECGCYEENAKDIIKSCYPELNSNAINLIFKEIMTLLKAV